MILEKIKKIFTNKYFLVIILSLTLVSIVFIVFSTIYSNWEEQSKIQKRYDSFYDKCRESLDISSEVNFERLDEVRESLEPILQDKLKAEYKDGYEDSVENWTDIKSFYITFDNGFYCHVLHSNRNYTEDYRVFSGTENYDTTRIYEYVCGENEVLNYRFYLNDYDDLEVVVEQ